MLTRDFVLLLRAVCVCVRFSWLPPGGHVQHKSSGSMGHIAWEPDGDFRVRDG